MAAEATPRWQRKTRTPRPAGDSKSFFIILLVFLPSLLHQRDEIAARHMAETRNRARTPQALLRPSRLAPLRRGRLRRLCPSPPRGRRRLCPRNSSDSRAPRLQTQLPGTGPSSPVKERGPPPRAMTQQRSLFAVWLSWQRLTAWSGKPRMAAAATAGQGELLPSPAPPVEPRGGRSRPSSTVLLIVAILYYISVMSVQRYVNGRVGGGDPEPSGDAPFDAGDSASYVLPRLEGVKVGYKQKVNLVPNKIHVMKTLSLKPPIFEIPDFLSEDECKLLIHLAEREGLKKSYTKFSSFDAKFWDILGMDWMDVFNYQDRNKDGKLQAIEVMSFDPFTKGLWVTPEDIQEMYAALKADPDGNGVLSLDEFKEVNMQDYFKYMARKKANMSDFVRNSQQTWLDQGKGAHPVMHSIQQRMIHLTHLPTEIVERSEYFQVVRYDQGGYYHAHLDSSRVIPGIGCSHTAVFGGSPLHSSCRYATILLYLNNVTGGGETTFPIADNSTYDYVSLTQNNIDLRDTRRHCDKGNLRIKPLQGTAVFWYNFLPDEEGWAGDLDDYSLHGGCLVTEGIKWVANNWINVDPNRWRQLLVQKYTRIVNEEQSEGVLDKSCSDVCEEPP